MRILLDECVDRRLVQALQDYDVLTVPQMGWASIKNGALLTLADKEFDVFLTVDRGVPQQQNLLNKRIALILLRAKTNRLADLLPLMPELIAKLSHIQSGQVLRIGESEDSPSGSIQVKDTELTQSLDSTGINDLFTQVNKIIQTKALTSNS